MLLLSKRKWRVAIALMVSLGTAISVSADNVHLGDGNANGLESISIGKGVVENQVGVGLGYNHAIQSDNGIAIGGWSTLGKGAKQGIAIGVMTYTGTLTEDEEMGEIPIDTPSKVVNKSEEISSGNYISVNGSNPNGPTVPAEDADKPANQSIAIGTQTRVYGYTAIGLGQAVRANGRDSISIGKASRVFLDGGIAMGSQAISAGKGSISMGSTSHSLGLQSMAFGQRSEVGKEASNSIAMGRWARTKNMNSIAIGAFSSTEGDAAPIDGASLFSGEKVEAAAGVVSVGTDPYEIEFTNDKMIIPDFKRRIANVAGGIKDNDAVNVKQLSSVVTAIGLEPDEVSKIVANAPDRPKTIVERIEELKAQGCAGLEGVNDAKNRANDAYDTAVHGGANAAALAAMKVLPYDANRKIQVMAGYGHYKGSSSIAIGVGYHQNNDTLFNAGISLGETAMWNAGMTLRIGSGKAQESISKSDYREVVEAYNDLQKKYEELKIAVEEMRAYMQSHN